MTARFKDAALENAYRETRVERDQQQVKLAAIVAFFASLGFAGLDYLVITENRTLAVTLRFLWASLAIGLFALLYVPWIRTRLYLTGWLAIVGSTGFYLAINSLSNPPDIYLSGYVIILFYLLFFFPISFPAMVAMSVTGAVVFAVAVPFTRSLGIGGLLTIYSQYLTTLIFGNFAVYLLNWYRRKEYMANREIAEQQQRYADLLNRIFPQGVVSRMQAGETRIADKFGNVAVLFADIVGFTETAARHSPEEVIEAIDGLFNRFDTLVAKHGVEKIKTIGDAYMAAAGVPVARDGHIQAMAELALDMLEVTRTCRDVDGAHMRIRIGIHAGPVIAGVIGEIRFGYDLWGDTVNLASRMQGLAKENTILVTEPVYRDLVSTFELKFLGPVRVKGKGDVETWQLVGH